MNEISAYWRRPRSYNGKNLILGIYKDVPALRIFDNVWFVGNDMMGSYLLKTSEGLILLDCMDLGCFEYLEANIKRTGFDPSDIKAILITHGHADHYGDADKFREKYGCKIYMTEVDEKFAQNRVNGRRPPLGWSMDGYLVPGEDFVLGDTRVEIYSTPGHTPGCASFIFDVYDCGHAHKFLMWGGTGPNKDIKEAERQIESVDYFDKICFEKGVDGELVNHPYTDNLIEKLEIIRNIVDGVSHPLVIGYNGVHSMMLAYRELYKCAVEKGKAGGK